MATAKRWRLAWRRRASSRIFTARLVPAQVLDALNAPMHTFGAGAAKAPCVLLEHVAKDEG
jgi:hypothetical protein